MSYLSIATCAADADFNARVASACAQEGETLDPVSTARTVNWAVASAADVEQAYESALAADNPAPGADPSVITDGMILAHVQAALGSGESAAR